MPLIGVLEVEELFVHRFRVDLDHELHGRPPHLLPRDERRREPEECGVGKRERKAQARGKRRRERRPRVLREADQAPIGGFVQKGGVDPLGRGRIGRHILDERCFRCTAGDRKREEGRGGERDLGHGGSVYSRDETRCLDRRARFRTRGSRVRSAAEREKAGGRGRHPPRRHRPHLERMEEGPRHVEGPEARAGPDQRPALRGRHGLAGDPDVLQPADRVDSGGSDGRKSERGHSRSAARHGLRNAWRRLRSESHEDVGDLRRMGHLRESPRARDGGLDERAERRRLRRRSHRHAELGENHGAGAADGS